VEIGVAYLQCLELRSSFICLSMGGLLRHKHKGTPIPHLYSVSLTTFSAAISMLSFTFTKIFGIYVIRRCEEDSGRSEEEGNVDI
jgi:hypothetical protein